MDLQQEAGESPASCPIPGLELAASIALPPVPSLSSPASRPTFAADWRSRTPSFAYSVDM